MLLDIIKQLYGDDATNAILKIIFEFLLYFMSGLFGSGIREYFGEKDKCLTRAGRIILTAMVTASIMFIFGNFLKDKIKDSRLLFGFGAGLALYLPNIKKSVKTGAIFKYVVGLFSDKLRKVLDEVDKDNSKKKK